LHPRETPEARLDKAGFSVILISVMTLYQELKEAGIKIDSHESDLYFENTPESRAILEKYPLEKKNSTRFQSSIDGTPWIDVPFAYLPFWEKRMAAWKRA
jgi:hypothetical protein